MEETISVQIPKEIIEKIEKRAIKTGFGSAASYITYVLKQVLLEEEKEENLSKEDEKKVRKTLKEMGYLRDE